MLRQDYHGFNVRLTFGKHSELILFKIDASRCDLRVSDPVTPETTVGEDFETGEIVKAGCHGQVEAVSFSGDDHALIVVISPVGNR